MTEPAPRDGRPVDREYLDLRLSELELKVRADLAQTETRLMQVISKQTQSVLIPFWVAMLGLLGALFTAVIVR